MRKIKLRPFVSSMFYVPTSHFKASALDDLKTELTLEHYETGGNTPVSDDDVQKKMVEVFSLERRGYIGIPRYFGMQRFGYLDPVISVCHGEDVRFAFNGTSPIKPRDDKQEEFFGRMLEASRIEGKPFGDYSAKAGTGTGKTASIINRVLRTKKPALIVVPTNRLKEQWLGSIALKKGLRFFCGEQFVDDWVGVAQQDVCDYENKAFVIAMVHSLVSRKYPDAFYRHFYSVDFDELHKYVAPQLSKALMIFPQAFRGGCTATPKEGSLSKIAELHFGPVSITSKQEVVPSTVYVCQVPKKLPEKTVNTYSKGSILTSLSQLDYRNDLIAKIGFYRGWKRGKPYLILSERVHQLQDLQRRLIALGIPRRKIALYVGRVYTGKFKVSIAGPDGRTRLTTDDGKPFPTKQIARKAANEFLRGKNKSLFTVKIEEDSYKPTDAYMDLMEKTCDVFLATYNIFSTGNDISRLVMGIEALPRTDQRQSLGRVLRPGSDDEREWYSLADEITLVPEDRLPPYKLTRLIRDTVNRKKRYKQQGARIVKVENVFEKFK